MKLASLGIEYKLVKDDVQKLQSMQKCWPFSAEKLFWNLSVSVYVSGLPRMKLVLGRVYRIN